MISDLAIFSICFILGSGVLSVLYSLLQHWNNSKIEICSHGYRSEQANTEQTPLNTFQLPGHTITDESDKLMYFHNLIINGSREYLSQQYGLCLSLSIFFTLLLFALLAWAHDNTASGIFICMTFFAGSLLSIIVGIIGMKAALYAGVRTTICTQEQGSIGYMNGFTVAFRGGAVFAFGTAGLGLLVLYGNLEIYRAIMKSYGSSYEDIIIMFAGFALGSSIVALVIRIGGGIFLNAADISSNLIGKVMFDIPDNDPSNPAGNLIDFFFRY